MLMLCNSNINGHKTSKILCRYGGVGEEGGREVDGEK